MSCNCKQKYDALKKFSDDYFDEDKQSKVKVFFKKLLYIPLQICFGILCGALVLVAAVPFLIYVIVNLMIGRDISFTIKPWWRKKDGRKLVQN